MGYRFQFRPYQRRFRQPLKTSHGNWEVREGIILRLTDDAGRVGWGEIAPLPWFGSETIAQALGFCRQLGEEVTEEEIKGIPEELPACQFGFESAVEDLSLAKARGTRGQGDKGTREIGETGRRGDGETRKTREIGEIGETRNRGKTNNKQQTTNNKQQTTNNKQQTTNNKHYSCLLPTGKEALQAWQTAWKKGQCTFKWKVGVSSTEEEIKVFEQLAQTLPATAKLRLDANGGLSLEEAKEWLRVADRTGIVEFLEQPLLPQQFDTMLELSGSYSTPLALDESVANLEQLEDCYQKGWRGIFVIKAAIAGSPKRLRQFCQEYKIDAVFSSVFETTIGRQAALRLAAELSHPNRAVGFGVNHWFREDRENWLENLWKTC